MYFVGSVGQPQRPCERIRVRDRKVVADAATTVGLGKQLQLSTVAEDVETEAQARTLADLQCDQGQGYYFARPMPGDAARAWLREHG